MKVFIIPLVIIVVSCSSPSKNRPTQASAELTSLTQEKLEAHVHIKQDEEGLKLIADAKGLEPNSVHGFHIHENGLCEGPDFKTAGGHYNPNEGHHSGAVAENKHFGDLGNLVANDKGVAHTEIIMTMEDGKNLESLVGRSIIIHANADDLVSQPAGNSGDRIACGIITK